MRFKKGDVVVLEDQQDNLFPSDAGIAGLVLGFCEEHYQYMCIFPFRTDDNYGHDFGTYDPTFQFREATSRERLCGWFVTECNLRLANPSEKIVFISKLPIDIKLKLMKDQHIQLPLEIRLDVFEEIEGL